MNPENYADVDDIDEKIKFIDSLKGKLKENHMKEKIKEEKSSKTKITIQISGGEKSGKSTVARLLAAFCHKNGFEYELDDNAGSDSFPSLNEIAQSVKDKT